ncbi:MAG: DUF4412 domain-containing protein [Verrucomicrobiota bacterium]
MLCVALIGRLVNRSLLLGALLYPSLALGLITAASAFEGRITAALTRGGEIQTFTYTVGPGTLRIERSETDRPYPGNLIALESGNVTLLFPHNRSFIRLKSPGGNAMPGGLPMSLPAGGPPPGIGPTNLPGMPDLPKPQMQQMPAGVGAGIPGGAMPAPPMMPMPDEALELKATGEKANLLGYDCAQYEIKQRGEIMEIWATDALLPFWTYLQSQLPRFGPRMIEQQWGDLLKARKLFPLLATLRFENGPERLRFEAKTVTPGKIANADGTLFQPPASYHEVEPLPF